MSTARRISLGRHGDCRRKLALEALEKRLLLAISPMQLLQGHQDCLSNGLAGLKDWAEGLDQYDLLSQVLPVAGQSLGDSLDLGGVLDKGLVAPLAAWLNGPPGRSSDDLVAAIQSLGGTFDDLTVLAPTGVSGGQDTGAGYDELVFNLVLQASRSIPNLPISLGPDGDAMGLGIDATTTVTFATTLDVALGMDLTSGLAPEDAFFIRVTELSATASASVTGLTCDVNVGFYDAELAGGDLSLNAVLDVTLGNPDADPRGNVTLAELEDTDLATLVTLAPSGSASGSLSILAAEFGGFDPSSLSPEVTFSSTNPFAAPDLSFNADCDELLNFTNVSSNSMLGLVNRLGTWLDELRETSVFDAGLHLVDSGRLGDVLGLGGVLTDTSGGLIAQLIDSEGVPTFDSAQTLATALGNALGLPPSTIAATYNDTTDELTYHLILERTFDPVTLPFGTGLDLGSLGNLSILPDASVSVNTSATLEFTLGVELSILEAQMVAEADGPADGRLGADAAFSLALGAAGPVAVTLSKTATDDNTSLDDLAADLNAALAAAGLGAAVTAGRTGNRITLTTAGRCLPAMLRLTAPAGTPILTEVHFRNGQMALEPIDVNSFIEDASISGSATLDAADIDATADLGFLGVSIADGFGSADVAVSLELEDPATHTPGGRLYLVDLFDALAGDITSIVEGPELSGSVDLTLPLAVTPNILGASHPANPELVVSWPDIADPNGFSLAMNDADLLLDFEHLDGAAIAGAMSALADYLTSVEGLEMLCQRIPVLDRSIGQIVDFAAVFAGLAHDLEKAPARVLQELETRIEDVFGLDDSAVGLSLVEDNTVVKIDITLGHAVSRQYPVDVDLEGLNLGEFGHLVDFRGTATVSAEAAAVLDLDFGIDLSDPESPRPFVYDTTGLALTAKAAATDIQFSTAVGPLSVWINSGNVLVDGDGNPATPDAAALALTLEDDDADGKIYLDELSLDQAQVSLDGQVHAVLPLYFPAETIHLGNIELAITDLGDILNTTTLTAPDFAETFGDFDLLNELGVVVDGVDYVLMKVQQALTSRLVQVNLPMIGDKLADLADFIGDIREDVIREIQERFDEALHRTPVVIQIALFDALGPDGLDILADKDASGTITRDDITVVLTDTDIDGQADDQVDIDLAIGKSIALVDESIDFDLGIPALGLAVDGDVTLELGFQWEVAMGISREYGFYIDTSPASELTIYLRGAVPGMAARGNLWFLQLDVTDDAQSPSALVLAVTVDLLDPRDDPNTPLDNDKLTFRDLTCGGYDLEDLIDVQIIGGCDINLNLLLSYKGDARFPSITADFVMSWQFQTGGLEGERPTLAFNNVRLNVGEWIADFATPILKKVQKFTEPMQPIIDFLTTPVPVLDDLGLDVTPLDVARALGYGDIADYVEAVAGVVEVINGIPVVGDDLYVPLGSFDLGDETDPRNPEEMAAATPRTTVEKNPSAELSGDAAGFLASLQSKGISFPIIEQPLSVFKLLLGQDVELFTYDMPDLKLDFPFPIIKIPIFPPYPVFLAFNGRIEAGVDLKFGYDTHGFRKCLETGDWWDVFSGFYISDRKGADGKGPDVPEGFLKGTISGGVEVNVWIIGAGAEAGVTLSLYADLEDPDGNGKVHFDEFLANLDLGLMSTFNVSGDITAYLGFYVTLLGQRVWEYPFAEWELADFTLTEPQIYHDRYTSNNGHVTSTYVGVGPGLHVDGLSLESSADEDWYRFDLIRPDSIDVDVRFSQSRGDVDITVYDSTGVAVLGQSNTQDDREVVSLVDLPEGTYYAKVTGSGHLNNYMFCVEPGETSTTRVIYVNPSSKDDRSDSFYTTEPGNDDQSGLLYRKPKASLAGVLAAYDLGPNDFVVFDTGQHASGAVIAAEDEGATYVGSVGGALISDVALNGSDDSRFYNLGFSKGGTGLTIGGQSTGNLVHYCRFDENSVGLRITSPAPNLIVYNSFTGNTAEGIHLAPGVTSTLRDNSIAASPVGVYCDSKVADFYRNTVHGNTVGLTSERGILGPDNPPPFGAAGGKEPNDVYENETGVLIPAGASGVIVRFTRIRNNSKVGIEQLGDNSLVIANDVYENPIGIRGTRVIGPSDWGSDLHNLIHNNAKGVWALPGADVRFNRIFDNAVGVYVADDPGDPIVHHNLIYGNTEQGVLVEGAQDVDIFNNTIYAPQGNGVELKDFASQVDLHDNIIWTLTGCGIYVWADSQFGYTSDYNNLYTSGGNGRVAWQGKDFFDVYDWQVEAESDLHSIGYTVVDPTLDDPQFVNLAAGDFHLQAGSTSIDTGCPASDFSLEPGPNGNRVDLGAYGNTLEAGVSADRWLRLTSPCYYTDLVPSRTYTIAWETYNVDPDATLDVDLMWADGGEVGHIGTTTVGERHLPPWSPADMGITGDLTSRYRIKVTAQEASPLAALSREAFAIPDVDPAAANTFYVDDRDVTNANDEYTPAAAGDNRNTGTSALAPKVVIRPIVLSYALDTGDQVLVDSSIGPYIHAVNLNLGGVPLAFDPRMNTVQRALITGPTDLSRSAVIDRANPYPGSVAFDLIDSDDMTIDHLGIRGAEIGVRARQGSVNFSADHDTVEQHTLDGISIEGGSDAAILDYCTVNNNGRDGIFVDSLLTRITYGEIHDNGRIGVALRSVGAAAVENCRVYANQTGIDVINPGPNTAVIGNADLAQYRGNIVRTNLEDGIFASGNVMVGCNNVYENARTGIRLDDGADSVRNVVRTHINGISALGSTSDVIENRVCNNVQTAIIASYASNVQRNVVYTNGQYGIHVDHFSGVIDHNLVYEDGDKSIWVEGPGAGAQLINNTVYEPCGEEEPGTATVTLQWQWMIDMEQWEPSLNFPVLVEGTAEIEYDPPIGLTTGGTFDLGPGGGIDALTPEAVPLGQEWQINTRIVSLDLASMTPTPLGPIEVHLDSSDLSLGQILVSNEGGFLTGECFFDVFATFVFPEHGTLSATGPMHVARSLDLTTGLGDRQVLQAPLVLGPVMPRVELHTDEFSWGTWGFEGTRAGVVSGFAVTNYQASIDVWNLAQAQSVIGNPANRSWSASETAATINYLNAVTGRFGGDSHFPAMPNMAEYDQFVVQATGTVHIPSEGHWTFGVNSDDGFSLRLAGAEFVGGVNYTPDGTGGEMLVFDGLRGGSDTLGTFYFPAEGDYDLTLVYFESGGGSEVELWAAEGMRWNYDPAFRLVGDADHGGLSVGTTPGAGFTVTNYKASIPNIANLADAQSVIDYPENQSWLMTETVATINYLNALTGRFAGDSPFPNMPNTAEYDRFVVQATGKVYIPEGGYWTFGVNSDDGFSLRVAGAEFVGGSNFTPGTGGEMLVFDAGRAADDTLGTFYFPAAGDYSLTMVFFESIQGSELELWAAEGMKGVFDPTFHLVGDTANGGLLAAGTPTECFSVTNYKSSIGFIENLAQAQSVIDNPENRSWSASETVATINYLNTGPAGQFGGDRPFPNMPNTADYDGFVVKATGRVHIPGEGDWTFGVNSDDGFSLQLSGATFVGGVNYTLPGTGGDMLVYDGSRGPGDTLGTFHFPAAGDYDLTLVYFEGSWGAEVELWAAQGTKPAYDSTFRLVGDTPNGGLGMVRVPTGSSSQPPQHRGRYCTEIGIHVSNQSEHVLVRNNAVYVEGCRHRPPSHDIIVEADSTDRWQSDFNIFTTTQGFIGQWAGVEAPTMANWQAASGDDPFSIAPPWWTIWVDPDGNDDLLGFQTPGPGDGRDDDLHLRSPFGEVARGALAPVADPEQLPAMQAVVWQFDPPPPDAGKLSPGVDWGDPSYDFPAEPLEHGKFINLGCYGNTAQASLSEPEYVHMVYPLGFEELVQGATYEIRWRTHDPMDPTEMVKIELRHGSASGPVESVIENWTAPNTGSYVWVVSGSVNTDYVIVVSRGNNGLAPPDVIGASRYQFSIDVQDTRPPTVLQTAPQFVEFEQPINATAPQITVTFSDGEIVGASSPNAYEFRGAGSNGIFDDTGDLVYQLNVAYAPSASYGDPSTAAVSLVDFPPATLPLPEGEYRFKVFANSMADFWGLNFLDGNGDGTAGDDYVRLFTIDRTSPTVSITSVGPSPRKDPVSQITIVFDEAVRGLGLADLRLTRNGGSNLLTEANILTTSDEITWTLGGLDDATDEPGSYLLQLTSSNLDIRDLAGNPLAMDASTTWTTDTIAPTVQVPAVAPDPRAVEVDQITFVFSEPVTDFGIGDLTLTRDGGSNLLDAGQSLTTQDFITWTLNNLDALTAADGSYTLSLDGDASGIRDAAGNLLTTDAAEVWRMDTAPPQPHVVDVSPDPRNSAVDEITIAFNEPVAGLDLADLTLTLAGGGNLLTGAQRLASVDGMNWTLGNLAGLTAAAGQYVVTLSAAGSSIQDGSGNLLAQDADETWLVDTTPPTASITAVNSDPHRSAVTFITVSFSEAVTGLDLTDLALTLDGGPNLLTPDQTLTTSDNLEWRLGGLTLLTGADGEYRLTLAATNSGIEDAAGNPLADGAVETWLMDGTPPSVDIHDVTADPRTTSVNQIEIVFNEPVEEFDLGDLVLMRDEGSNLLPGSGATLTPTGDDAWILGNLAGITGGLGSYALILAAPDSHIADAAGNPLPRGTTETWIFEPHTMTWKGQTDGNWQNADEWLGGPPDFPNATVDAVVDAPKTVTVDGSEEANSLEVSNGGRVEVTSTGNLTVANAVSVTASAELEMADAAALAVNGTLTVDNGSIFGGTLSADAFDLRSGTVSTDLSGPGAVTKTTGGTVVLSGTNTYDGGTTISGGLIHATTPAALGAGPVVMTSGGALTVALSVQAGVEAATRVAAFSDPWSQGGPADPEDFQTVIDWGDGSTSNGTVRVLDANPRSYEVVGSHTYARTSACRTVDADLGGPVVLSSSGTPSYASGRWTVPLRATNTSSTAALQNVHFVLPFLWYYESISPPEKVAFAWDDGAHQWTLDAKSFALASYGVDGQNEQAPMLMPMDRDMVDTPLSWAVTYGDTATVQVTDSLPALGLGDFSPTESKNFTLYCGVSEHFYFDMAGFFVAAREPSRYDMTVTISKPSVPGESRGLTSAATVVTPAVGAWDGEADGGTPSADANWQTAENWAGDAAPQADDALLFSAGAAQSANTNNYPAGTAFHSIAFSGGGYSVGGAGVGLAAGIVNKATALAGNVLDLGIRLDAPQTFQNLSASALAINGPIDLNGNALTVDGPGPISLAGAIDGHGSLEKKGTGTTALDTSNIYDGGTTVAGGTLEVNAPGALPAGTSLTITGGAVVLRSGLGRAIELGGLSIAIGGGAAPQSPAPAGLPILESANTLNPLPSHKNPLPSHKVVESFQPQVLRTAPMKPVAADMRWQAVFTTAAPDARSVEKAATTKPATQLPLDPVVNRAAPRDVLLRSLAARQSVGELAWLHEMERITARKRVEWSREVDEVLATFFR